MEREKRGRGRCRRMGFIGDFFGRPEWAGVDGAVCGLVVEGIEKRRSADVGDVCSAW